MTSYPARRRGRMGYICGGDMTPVPDTTSACPRRDEHTPSPAGYVEWHTWTIKMAQTHRQTRHQPCGLWAVWVPR